MNVSLSTSSSSDVCTNLFGLPFLKILVREKLVGIQIWCYSNRLDSRKVVVVRFSTLLHTLFFPNHRKDSPAKATTNPTWTWAQHKPVVKWLIQDQVRFLNDDAVRQLLEVGKLLKSTIPSTYEDVATFELSGMNR